MTEKAAQTQFSKEGGIIALRTVARQLGVNITKRRAAAAVPFRCAGTSERTVRRSGRRCCSKCLVHP